MVETLLVVSVIGIIAAITFPKLANLNANATDSKLESDIRNLNSSIKIYLASGGNFADVTTTQEVIDKLKLSLSKEESAKHVGYTGAILDPRTAVEIQSDEDASRTTARAVWNAGANRFDIATTGRPGITRFYFDDAAILEDGAKDSREASALQYNDESGWIWKYQDQTKSEYQTPTEVDTIPVSLNPTLPVSVPTPPRQLFNPGLTPEAGIFEASQFPLTITISNPNPASTWVMASLNNAAFTKMDTGTIQLQAEDRLQTYVNGDPREWNQSGTISGHYISKPDGTPDPLRAPEIQLSAEVFTDTTTTISFSFLNPNPSGSSQIRFALATPEGTFSNWNLYTAGSVITASRTTWTNGFRVGAFAETLLPLDYANSPVSERRTSAEFFGVPVQGNVLFVIDASGSMKRSFRGTTRFATARTSLINAIQQLPSDYSFNVAMFDASTHWVDGTYTLHPATTANRDSMISQVQNLQPDAGTNYAVGLGFAAQFTPRPDQVIFLSDGAPDGHPYNIALGGLVAYGIRVDTIGIDVANDQGAITVMQNIANATGGKFIQINP